MDKLKPFDEPEIEFKVDFGTMTATDEHGMHYELDADTEDVYVVSDSDVLTPADAPTSALVREAFRRATMAREEWQAHNNAAAQANETLGASQPVTPERAPVAQPKSKAHKVARAALAAALITSPATVPVVGYTAGRIAASYVPGADDFNLPSTIKDGFIAEKDCIVKVFTSEDK